MLPHQDNQPQPCRDALKHIGVGIDTSRYGHYAAFLRGDLQPAAAELAFAESGAGYALLREHFAELARRFAPAHFRVRLDVAGQYADNLINFLQSLAAGNNDTTSASFTMTISCGDPQRNKNYRAAIFGSQKSDPIEARAAARYAVTERPKASTPLSAELRTVRQVAARLQAVVRQRTRLVNQFHHLLALSFPELALRIKDIAAGWVLELIHRYPSATLLANTDEESLARIAYLPDKHIQPLLELARSSVASLDGDTIEELLRDQVRQLRDVGARQKRLEKLLANAYRRLPRCNHLASIPGIGDVTAAVLTAFVVDIERFDTPNKLVAYFGVLPIQVSSGVDRDGKPRGPARYVMSRRGNDLVRRYLWMAALSAIRCNPAVRALYLRVVAKHPERKAVAVGHAMRKLLHLAFALWKTDQPFDAEHYPWDHPAHVAGNSDNTLSPSDSQLSQQDQAAGHKLTAEPARTVVTAACTPTVAEKHDVGGHSAIDFAHLKRQLSMADVLDHLGLLSSLRGAGPQRRGPCPIHRGDARGRTFSVHLDDGVFHCFDKTCGKKGDIIELWANVNALSLRDAATDLVRTFQLEPIPQT